MIYHMQREQKNDISLGEQKKIFFCYLKKNAFFAMKLHVRPYLHLLKWSIYFNAPVQSKLNLLDEIELFQHQ